MILLKTVLLSIFILVAFMVLGIDENGLNIAGIKAFTAGICLLGAEKVLDYFVISDFVKSKKGK